MNNTEGCFINLKYPSVFLYILHKLYRALIVHYFYQKSRFDTSKQLFLPLVIARDELSLREGSAHTSTFSYFSF